MASDSVFAILFGVFLGIAYLLWLAEKRPGMRLLLVVLAVVFFAIALGFREAGIAREVASAQMP